MKEKLKDEYEELIIQNPGAEDIANENYIVQYKIYSGIDVGAEVVYSISAIVVYTGKELMFGKRRCILKLSRNSSINHKIASRSRTSKLIILAIRDIIT